MPCSPCNQARGMRAGRYLGIRLFVPGEGPQNTSKHSLLHVYKQLPNSITSCDTGRPSVLHLQQARIQSRYLDDVKRNARPQPPLQKRNGRETRQKIQSRKWGSYPGSPYSPSLQLSIDPSRPRPRAFLSQLCLGVRHGARHVMQASQLGTFSGGVYGASRLDMSS